MENNNQDSKSLFEQIGGREAIDRVMKTFYDLVYKDPWIGKYFEKIDQKHIEAQQGDFTQGFLGGGHIYCGALPIPAHKHMFITEELFDLRTSLLKKALIQEKIPDHVIDKWIAVDSAFRGAMVKKSVNDCQKRFYTDEIIGFDKNGNKIAA